ncbi:TPA: hypothetical protein N0F65_008056 [Lagenidium giganteum]|uniref:Cyclic nucleotide-binding domain-containing protein n=1 Tax=Lagenidium giganteum TaxID=4803 RepID=A0AAV2YR80_9STRA|nr:TPA: hypothetical protein N0F65_008056 [Lagenidium giganteum]
MKFRFCGGLEPPDWVQAEVALVGHLLPDEISRLCDAIARNLRSPKERVAAISLQSDLSSHARGIEAVTAWLQFVLTHAAKYYVTDMELLPELEQLGLGRAPAEAIRSSFLEHRHDLRRQLRAEKFTFPHVSKLSWRLPTRENDLHGVQSVMVKALLQSRDVQALPSKPTTHIDEDDETLRAEQTTTKLGSRFHLRKLFLRHVELTESELEFVIKYLIHETTVQEQMWWRALTAYERLELVGQFTLHHVPRGEEHNLWFASIETTKDCILLYGKAEAKPIDRESTPVVNFLEGSVFGNLTLPYRLRTQLKKFQSTQPIEATHAPTSAAVFRRLKRETAFRDSIEKYSRVVVYGPADYFILTSTAVAGTTLKAVERVEQDNWLKSYGLDRFAGCIRRATFEPGAVLVREGEMASAVLIVIQGECRASVEIANRTTRPKSSDESSKSHRKEPTLAQEVLMHQHRFEVESTQLAIATLGANSVIGDVSIMLNIPEPTTVQAITPVVALSLSHEYLLHELEVKDQPTSASFEQLKLVAFDTLKFTLDRIQVEAEVEQCDQTLKILDLERVIAANEEGKVVARLTICGI